MSSYLMSNTNMLKMYGRDLISRQWVNIMIFIWNLIFSYSLMHLRISGRPACDIIILIHVISWAVLRCYVKNDWYKIRTDDWHWHVSIHRKRNARRHLIYFWQIWKANYKYMKNFDERTSSMYVMYLDANNLYGWAVSQYLPTGGFKWWN